MPRAGLSTDVVVAAAAELSDERGLEAMTLAELAERLGVRLPSLYKHVHGTPALRRHLAVRAKNELAALLSAAATGRTGRAALQAVAVAYLDWARAHPGRYAASLTAPAADDPADTAASDAVVQVVFAALSGYRLDDDTLIDSVRSLRAVVHGFVALERAGGFGLERPVADSVAWALDSLDASMTGTSLRSPT